MTHHLNDFSFCQISVSRKSADRDPWKLLSKLKQMLSSHDIMTQYIRYLTEFYTFFFLVLRFLLGGSTTPEITSFAYCISENNLSTSGPCRGAYFRANRSICFIRSWRGTFISNENSKSLQSVNIGTRRTFVSDDRVPARVVRFVLVQRMIVSVVVSPIR